MLPRKLEKMKKLEGYLKNLHHNPPKTGINRDPKSKEFLKNFWDYHIWPVMEESSRMSIQYGGDEDIIWIGAMMHDVGLVYKRKNHDILGAKIAHEILLKRGFDKKTAEKVRNIVLRHRCKKEKPETVEEKIVTTADAIAHFSPAYYLGLAVVANEDYQDLMENNFKKLVSDFENKIFFPGEKRKFKKVVGEFKKVFSKRKK
jgi:HD superfamily phosphodiesterase